MLARLVVCFVLSWSAGAAERFQIAWSLYVGWVPWDYADKSGILAKWAHRYEIEVEVVRVDDYAQSIERYGAGEFHACAMTNVDALSIATSRNVTSTALIIGDYSNGNDGIVMKGRGRTLADIAGERVYLVARSVSHYTLARALSSVGLSEGDVMLVDTPDSEIVSAFARPDARAVVSWNPFLEVILAMPNVTKVFDSSSIDGEIIDAMIVRSETLAAHPELGKVLSGAWYDVMAAMTDGGKRREVLTRMGEASGTSHDGFRDQLDSTMMFYRPQAAVDFVRSMGLVRTMSRVAGWSLTTGMLGDGVQEIPGIAFPNGVVIGNPERISLRFDDAFMQMAADGEL